MAQAMKIAIVDDERDMRQSISQWLALSGYDTETFASAEDALKTLGPEYPGIVISDIKMPGMDGMQFLKKLMGSDSALPVIMITGRALSDPISFFRNCIPSMPGILMSEITIPGYSGPSVFSASSALAKVSVS